MPIKKKVTTHSYLEYHSSVIKCCFFLVFVVVVFIIIIINKLEKCYISTCFALRLEFFRVRFKKKMDFHDSLYSVFSTQKLAYHN